MLSPKRLGGSEGRRAQITRDLTTEELIDGRVGLHDSTHFEVKLDYSIDSERKANRYRVESYFFVPRSLGINKNTYPRESFYTDTQSYIRLKTPSLDLRSLADLDEEMSPLHRFNQRARDLGRSAHDRKLAASLSQELRMFGCIARAQLRDQVADLRAQIDAVNEQPDDQLVTTQHIERAGANLLAGVSCLLGSWRELRADVLNPSRPRNVRKAYAFVDEYLSVVIENELTRLIRGIDQSARVKDAMLSLREQARSVIVEERNYRRSVGYEAVIEDAEGSHNEHYVYRRGLLKKFVNSVLWLEVDKAKEGKRIADLGAAIAAGVAMAVAIIATIVHMQWYVINTAGFVVAATITYIAKDRIKDWLKHYLSSRLSAWLADYSVRILDPDSGVKVGRCRENVTYMDPEDVPRAVHELRNVGSGPMGLPRPEVVLRYQKDIKLRGRQLIERLHLEDYDVNDILRFGLRQLLVRTDDPFAVVPTYDARRDRVERREFPKVYHLNVVMVLRAQSAPERPVMRRVRVVFDKSGIRRLDELA